MRQEVEMARVSSEASLASAVKNSSHLQEELKQMQDIMSQKEGGASDMIASMQQELQVTANPPKAGTKARHCYTACAHGQPAH